eukprot:9770421-Alexandrium_andersonii.AAC.1
MRRIGPDTPPILTGHVVYELDPLFGGTMPDDAGASWHKEGEHLRANHEQMDENFWVMRHRDLDAIVESERRGQRSNRRARRGER